MLFFTIREARLFAADSFLSSHLLTRNEYGRNAALFDADILIAHVLKKERSWILSHSDLDFSPYKKEFDALVKRRSAGLPIAYLIGKKDFFARSFYVNEDVLIPKPDTETLVEQALNFAMERFKKNEPLFVLDICTGSGCIGISLAAELYEGLNKPQRVQTYFDENFFLVLADISEGALEVCKKNIDSLLPAALYKKALAVKADLRLDFPRVPDSKRNYDLITANPPYVPSKLTESLLEDGRSEPRLALDGGDDGLELIPPLAQNSYSFLNASGKLFVEVGEYHASQASEIFKSTGFSHIQIHKDLAGSDRVIECTK
ncbi:MULTISPECIES: peptide chain release factor N(5)-glutamine methyltransferase [unclassified Treponema]|uniref:peptide chain release factor N(5)-glutamine methyltransferase n=1 Tax=unclassified Treponema TaxID=2638727 RepID=UPI0020A2B1B7|nr:MULTISPECIES: peptide chain release factor N(5)-glutamine methyltransferase [unclassified Treponema]UTC67414.1 peptide chain release factor N(5)-glutamine methyltransferase [Treponema sp. OMZ 789]UTC70142.1 peptide chain release factor N(5)-glutamine methyltransferase [Treponema sp. OMZ 790]UTC72857.1 peptide chain release factor N(5)-glutamine methyltransferase [Treponema sp. OMZ 791]